MANNFVNKAQKSNALRDIHDARIDDSLFADIERAASVYEFTITGNDGPTQEQIQHIWENKPKELVIYTDEDMTLTCYLNAEDINDDTHGRLTYITTDKHGVNILRFGYTSKDGYYFDSDYFDFEASGGIDYAESEQIDAMFPQWYSFPEPSAYTLSLDFTNVGNWSISDANGNMLYDGDALESGGRISGSIYPASGYDSLDVTVYMNDTDITDTAWSSSKNELYVSDINGSIRVVARGYSDGGDVHHVYRNFTNVSTNYDKDTTNPDGMLQMFLTCDEHYVFDSVTVMMGNDDVTQDAWRPNVNNYQGQVYIRKATDDITVNATAVYNSSETYHNVYIEVHNIGNWYMNDSYGNSLSNGSQILAGSYASGHFEPDYKDGYDGVEMTITMNNVDITDSAWDSDKHDVNIGNIDGDISIVATGTSEQEPDYYTVNKSGDSNSWVNDIYDSNENVVASGDSVMSGTYIHGSCGWDTKSGNYYGMHVTISVGGNIDVDTDTTESNYEFSLEVTGDTYISVYALENK